MPGMDKKAARLDARMAWLASRARGRVLDVGCSRSFLGARVAERGLDYLGLDLNPESVEATREALAAAASSGPRAEAEVADFSEFTTEERFETVVLAEILEHQEDPGAFLTRATTLLVAGGQVLMTTPFGWMPDPTHLQSPFASDHIAWCQQANLRILEMEIGDYHVRTRAEPGAGHALDLASLLRDTEREAEAMQRFWIGERDRQASRVETLLGQGQKRLAELEDLRQRLRAARKLNPVEVAKRLARRLVD
ncbi:MAG: methyltransferase domain-containing protein [Myxococcota bacterium]